MGFSQGELHVDFVQASYLLLLSSTARKTETWGRRQEARSSNHSHMYRPLEFMKPLSELISNLQDRRADASVTPILQIRNMVQAGGEPKHCGATACVQISKISCPRVFQFSENLSRGNQTQAWGPKGVEGKGTMVHCMPTGPRCQS